MRLQGKFEIDHSWDGKGQRADVLRNSIEFNSLLFRISTSLWADSFKYGHPRTKLRYRPVATSIVVAITISSFLNLETIFITHGLSLLPSTLVVDCCYVDRGYHVCGYCIMSGTL